MGQKDNTQVTPLNEEQLVEKQIELDAREKTLEESENKLNEKEKLIEEREKSVESREKSVTKKEDELAELQASLDAKTAEEEEKKMPGLNFEFEGESYKFKDSAPKKIRIAGKIYSQAEIVKKKDILLELVGGNSGLIQKTIQ